MRLLLPVALLAPLSGCGLYSGPTPTPKAAEQADLDFPVGAFALTERSGKAVTDADLRGKVWVASFVFTRCTGPCPQVTATVARLQKELPNDPNLKLVTFTVDPTRDDPAELMRYAEHFKADPERWLFLTGDEKAIHELSLKRFKLAAGRKEDAKPGDEFDHSTRLAVVDKKGVVRATFEGVRDPNGADAEARFEDGLKKLKEKVAALLKE
jgi:cytochrome oxidase Cu insertion factor (SCO1/SenC/PrrC family)